MNDIMQMLSQIKQNPSGFIMQRGFNIPQDAVNDPNKIIQHLMNTGQVSQEQYNKAVSMAKNLGIKVG